jgi:glycosyltransferase involved in cell wall biosynthesis
MSFEKLAVYTTVYPSVTPYLADWHKSVQQQTDKKFDLYIGVDSLTPEEIAEAMGDFPHATLFSNPAGLSAAQIRNAALERLVDEYDAIVLVDSDDIMHPSRVNAARAALQTHDVTGCALRLIDQRGRDLGFTFGPASNSDYGSLLARYNVFGLSNTAYRATTLRRCLPIPDDCILIDWLLATRAWARGAKLDFDHVARMSYRQYRNNTARVLPPFSAQYIKRAAALVVDHYRLLLATDKLEGWVSNSLMLATAFRRANSFHQAITTERRKLERYVKALNMLTPSFVWWWCVAHPQLEDIWKN